MRRVGRAVVATLIVSGIGIFGTAGWVATAPHSDPVSLSRIPAEPAPDPLVSGEPDPDPEPEPGPPVENETAPPTEPEESPEVEVPPGEGEGEDVPEDEVPQQRPATPPNVTVTQIPWPSIALAVATLTLGGVGIFVLVRRGRRDAAADPDTLVIPDTLVTTDTEGDPDADAGPTSPVGVDTSEDSALTLAAMIATGELMIDGGYPVDRVQNALDDIARVNGASTAEIITFPTAVLVSLRTGDTVQTEAVSTGRASLLLFQLEALDTAVQEASRGALEPDRLLTRMRVIRRLVPPFGFVQRVIASAVMSIGLAMLLDASWAGMALAGILGGFVGALMLLESHIESRYQTLLIVAAAFVVALVVFLVVRTNLDPGILPSLVAPLVMLLPGALLTTGAIELAAGEIMAGSARLASGAMRLVLLAFGIVAAAALVGLPSIQLDSTSPPLGAVAPWIGVAVFGVGLVVYQCARPRSLPWILLLLYVAYAAQVIGGVFLGAVLSAAIGALVMTPVAVLISRQRTGPPAIVSFLPAFLILVPGALGLVGVTSILDGDSSGLATLTTTVATMVSITLGVLVGLSLSNLQSRRSARRRESAADEPIDEPVE